MHTAGAPGAIRAERKRPELVPPDAREKLGVAGRDRINTPQPWQHVSAKRGVSTVARLLPHW
jgi:hypothetical protein